MKKSIRVTLSLDLETQQLLKELSNSRHQTMSQIIRDAIIELCQKK